MNAGRHRSAASGLAEAGGLTLASMATARSSRAAAAVRVPKTAELLAGHIRKQIVRGELAANDALASETVLMEEFGVSRPTLREAFRILESEGLITVRRGAHGGARVQAPSIDVAARYTGLVLQHRGASLADVLDARVIVEAPAAGIVGRRADRVACATELSRWLDAFESNHPVATPGYAGDFHGFNRLLVSMTGNETLVLITSMLEAISDVASVTYTAAPHPNAASMARQATRTRRKLIELIGSGDADSAEALFEEHLRQAGKVLMDDQRGRLVDVLG